MRFRHLALGGVAGVMGLGLIGVGAHATFTTSATAHQVVSTGTVGLVLHTAPGTAASGNTTNNLTLKTLTTGGSTFLKTEAVTIKNSGTDPIKHFHVTSSATPGNTLAAQVFACVTYGGTVLYNGHANAASVTQTYTLPPGHSVGITIQLYDGPGTTNCGPSAVPSLTQIALGESTTFTMHVVGTG